MGDVIEILPAKNPDVVLEKAIGAYSECLILGYDKEDFLHIRASLGLDKADMLLLVEQFKHELLSGTYDVE